MHQYRSAIPPLSKKALQASLRQMLKFKRILGILQSPTHNWLNRQMFGRMHNQDREITPKIQSLAQSCSSKITSNPNQEQGTDDAAPAMQQ